MKARAYHAAGRVVKLLVLMFWDGTARAEPSWDVAIIDLLGRVLFLNLSVHDSGLAIVVMGSIRLGLKAEVGPTDKQLQYQYIIEVVAGCHSLFLYPVGVRHEVAASVDFRHIAGGVVSLLEVKPCLTRQGVEVD